MDKLRESYPIKRGETVAENLSLCLFVGIIMLMDAAVKGIMMIHFSLTIRFADYLRP